MRMHRLILALSCAFASCLCAHAQVAVQESVSGLGGTLRAPAIVGQKITANGIRLANGSTVSFSCPITFFGTSTYQWNWFCNNGTITVDGKTVATVNGKLTLTCSGGGRGGRTPTCWHVFSGIGLDNDSDRGAVIIAAKGGPNNASGTVKAFFASW